MASYGIVFEHSSCRLRKLSNKLKEDDDLGYHLPGLAKLLDDMINTEVDMPREESVRRLLKVFWKSETDGTYSQILCLYSDEEAKLIREFVEDDIPAKYLGRNLSTREGLPVVTGRGGHVKATLRATSKSKETSLTEESIHLYNDENQCEEIPLYVDEEFQNWGRTVKNTPHLTFVPSTVYGIQQIVKYAKSKNMNVRASGYRHSWSSIFGSDGQIVISTLGLFQATTLPNIESLPGSEFFVQDTELNSITLVGQIQKGQKRLVRVGTATTNQMFRRWCNQQELDVASTLPLNVIMVETTLGGSNGPICHGAGRRHPTLSDLVEIIEYVDANGNLQTISRDKEPGFILAASGCFGLLGIVTHITLRLDPMRYTAMMPRKIPVMQAIPPPPGLADEDIPKALLIPMTLKERAKAQEEFERHAANDYYAEWFWFPYTSKVWVNCWDAMEDGQGASEYPSAAGDILQWIETISIQIIQESEAICNLQHLCPFAQTTLLSKLGLHALPDITDPQDAIKTKLPNALHFRRATQNVRVRDMEVEIPLQPKEGSLRNAGPDDEIDWAIVQKAWWDAILVAYRHSDTCPQRMPLEMRVTGSSRVTMAPFRGHTLGTCSIEVLTLHNMETMWQPYAQDVLDRWMELKDAEGNYLATRPHWAKEWALMNVRGRPMIDYMKESYADAITEFCQMLGQIAKKQGWDLDEARQRFSNDLLNQIFFT